MKNKILLFTTLIFLTTIDQISKQLVVLINPIIDLKLFTIRQVHNTGASFGLFQGNNLILGIISSIVLLLIIINFKKFEEKYHFPLSILTSGILGNLIDRMFRGFVVDMIDLGWFPVFNIADSCIFIGIVWICTLLLIEDYEEKKKRNKQN